MQSLWPFRKEPTHGLRKMGGPAGTSRISVVRGKGPPLARISLSSSGWMKWMCSEEAVTSSTSTSRVEGMLTMVLRTVEGRGHLKGRATHHVSPQQYTLHPQQRDLGQLTSFLFLSFLSNQHFPATPDSLATLAFNFFFF